MLIRGFPKDARGSFATTHIQGGSSDCSFSRRLSRRTDGRCCVCEVAATYLVRPAAATLHRSLNCSTALLVPPCLVARHREKQLGPAYLFTEMPSISIDCGVLFRQVVTSAVNEARLRHIVCKYG